MKVVDLRTKNLNNLTNILNPTNDKDSEDKKGITGVTGKDTFTQLTTGPGQTDQAQQPTQTQQQTNQATKAPTTPSRSGMFTNIKSFLEKNKPVIQQMGQQAGRQFASTAEKVRQEAASRAQTYKDTLGETEKDVQSQIAAGETAVDVAVGPQPAQQTETTQPTTEAAEPEELVTLDQYAQRAQETARQAQELNIQEQARKAARLQQQASGIVSDAGRQNLLRNVFGRRSRQYSTGAQALDQLLLSQSPQAAQQLQETVQRSSKGLEDISRQQQEAQNRLQALRALGAGAGEQLEKYGIDALKDPTKKAKSKTSDYAKDIDKKKEKAYKELDDRYKKSLNNLQNNIDDFYKRSKIFWKKTKYVLGVPITTKVWSGEYKYTLDEGKLNDYISKNDLGDFEDSIREVFVSGYKGHDWDSPEKELIPGKGTIYLGGATPPPFENYLYSPEKLDEKLKKYFGDTFKNVKVDEDKYYSNAQEEVDIINRLNRLLGREEVQVSSIDDYLKNALDTISKK